MTTATAETARAFASSDHRLLVGGRRVESQSDRVLDVEDPATTERIATTPCASEADIDSAVAAAREAFSGAWASVSPPERTKQLLRIAELIEANADELAALESLDNGKAIVEARFDIAGAAEVFRYYAGWPTKLHGETNPTEARFLSYTVREPVGVCAQIVPWNFPLLMTSWKVAPALACGNTVVLKPAEQTPLSALRLADLLLETSIHGGVVNVVTGDGATGAYLAAHAGVDKVAFTGSTEVGRSVMAGAASTLKRLSLELGGKNANLVFADADLDRAVTGAVEGAFENAGQACTAGSRLLVERSIYDDFLQALVERAGQLVVGPGLDESTQIGALVSAEQRGRVEGYVAIGVEEGAELALGGTPFDAPGHFVQPTVFANAAPAMRISQEEIFGPVVGVTAFDSEADAVAIANSTEYGLAAGVWTGNVKRAHRVARALRAGTVWINAYGSVRPTVPFGGVKQSGYGRELGMHSLDLYTELKSIFVDVS